MAGKLPEDLGDILKEISHYGPEKVVVPDETRIDNSILVKVAERAKDGKIVAFPTETVYVIGASILYPQSLEKILSFRPNTNEFNFLKIYIPSLHFLVSLVEDLPSVGEELIERFWPGPLALVFKARKGSIPGIVLESGDRIVVRYPDNRVAQLFMENSEIPLAGIVASPERDVYDVTGEAVVKDYPDIDVLINSGPTKLGVEATVVDITTDPPEVLKVGAVRYEDIREAIGSVVLRDTPEANFISYPVSIVIGENVKDTIVNLMAYFDSYEFGGKLAVVVHEGWLDVPSEFARWIKVLEVSTKYPTSFKEIVNAFSSEEPIARMIIEDPFALPKGEKFVELFRKFAPKFAVLKT